MDTQAYQNKLEEEKRRLEQELNSIGKRVPGTSEWNTAAEQIDLEFQDEAADKLEDFAERQAAEISLENRYKAVTAALDRITDGSYGKCEVCNQPIESARLEINPAAETCTVHRDEKLKN